MPLSRRTAISGFTLIEFFVVLIIIIILALIATIFINPVELTRRSRDSERLAELNSLNKALNNMRADNIGLVLGDANTVYISIPSDDPQCTDLNLPPLPDGWSYRCAPASAYRKANGSGWIPVDFQATSFGPQFSALAVDPLNIAGAGFYYTYVPSNTGWELTTILESEKQKGAALSDGGATPGVFETGPAPGITPPTRDVGLIGYWRFEEAGGEVALDSSGEGNHSNNPPPYGYFFPDRTTNGKAGSAVDFCPTCFAVSPRIAVTSTIFETFSGNQPFSISAWIKSDASDAVRRAILAKGNYGSSGSGFGLHIISRNLLFGFHGTTGGIFTSSQPITVGTWFHVAATYTGGSSPNARMYINGSIVASGTITSVVPATNFPLLIGYFNNGAFTGPFDGVIDEVRFYNRAISDAEVGALFGGGH